MVSSRDCLHYIVVDTLETPNSSQQILEWNKTAKCLFLSTLQHRFAPILISNGKYQSLLPGSHYEKVRTAHTAILLA